MMTRERINELAKAQRKEVEAICQDRDDDILRMLQLLLPTAEQEKAIKFSRELTIIHGTLYACADEEGINRWDFTFELFRNDYNEGNYQIYRQYIMDSLATFCDGINEQYDAFQMLVATMRVESRRYRV